MTEQQTEKKKEESREEVILSDRFVHRESAAKIDPNWFFLAEPDQIIERLSEHFALAVDDVYAVTGGKDKQRQKQQSRKSPRSNVCLRTGIQLPKEGQNGTGN